MFTNTLLTIIFLLTFNMDDTSDPSLVDRVKIEEKILSLGSPSSAWGAYYAGKYGLKECIPALRELLARENRRVHGPVPPVKKAALDALIRLDADVPAELLSTGYHKDYLPETLILLAKDTEENREALFDLMDHGPAEEQHWWAAAGILASLKPQGLAERLLKEVQLTLSITVRDPGSDLGCVKSFSGGSGRWLSTNQNLFPPRPTYLFSTKPEIGAVVLQVKPVTIYYQRSEGSKRGKSPGKVGSQTRTMYALQFITAMLNKPVDGFPVTGVSYLAIPWIDEGDYTERVVSQLKQLKSSYERLLEELCTQNLLAADAAGEIPPNIKLEAHDLREIKEPSIPTVSTQE